MKPTLRTRFWYWLRGVTLVPYVTLIATRDGDGRVRCEFECLPGDETFCATWRESKEREGMTITTRSGYRKIRRRNLTRAMRVASDSHKRAGWPNSEEIPCD